MCSTSRVVALAALLGAAATGMSSSTASATVLTFDMGVSSGTTVRQTYGDRVGVAIPGPFMYGDAGGPTPNVVVEYTPVLILSNDPAINYGDLEGVLYRQGGSGSDGIIEILFTADQGYQVCLNSFDLGARVFTSPGAQEDLPVKSIRVEDGPGNVLWGINYTQPTPDPMLIIPGTDPLRHNTYDFDGIPMCARQVRIVINLNQIPFKIDRFAIDNINFGQMLVPSPGSSALLAGSMLVAGLRRRRR